MKKSILPLLFLGVLFVFPASAQEGQEAGPPLSENAVVLTATDGASADAAAPVRSFGGQNDLTTISWTEFRPYTSNATYTADLTNGGIWTTGGSSLLHAPVPNSIPAGADINQIVFYVRDSDASNDFTGSLCRYWTDSGGGTSPGGSCPFSVSTTGTPGDTVAFGDPNLTMDRRFDIAGGTALEVVNWVLKYNDVLSNDGTIRLHQVRIRWTRQISPAPGTATFGDVSTGHPFFQHIEALSASGITAGCGGGNFCPDDPLTRGQMAVFLAKALGLHWPGY